MQIKRINKTTRPIFKNNKDLNIGEKVLTPFGKKKIVAIYDQGLSKVYKIYLSDGRSFRTNKNHLNTVSFRHKNGIPIWENLTTSWIIKNKDKYIFRFPLDKDINSFSKEDRKRISTPEYSPDSNNIKTFINNAPIFIQNIERVEDENTRCISLNYPEGLYYTGNKIITHNSFTSTLWSLYITTHLWSMRDPKKFFGLSQATSIVHGLISFTMDKAQQLLLQPFFQILLSSPKFKRVKQEEYLLKHQTEEPNTICWTSAGKMGALQFYNDIHYIIASSPAQLLGLNMISAIFSEISFFVEKGFSTEYIWRIYQDGKARVRSRFEDKYFAGTIIDSSPNDIELSPIDKYIFSGEAVKDPKNYVVTGAQWDFLPNKFPEWKKTGKTFPVFRGSQGEPAKLLHKDEVVHYPEIEVYHVPIDIQKLFEENTIKNVKDYCGWPSGSQGILIREESIIEKMFTPQLKNIYTYIKASASKSSHRLIWNTIAPKFFIKYDKGYEFYRNPIEKRYLHIDQAETGDLASISMVHPEISKDGEIIFITDFNIAISPEKDRINLDAIRLFILDLKLIGKIDIAMVTFDQYQSSSTIQFLKEKGFNASLLSVDRDPKIYLTYISLIQSGRIKSGRNIFLKNNLKSLQEVSLSSGRKKIDHTKGKIIYQDTEDWKMSEMGKYAKDISDSHCGAVWNCLHNFIGVPRMLWEDKTNNDFKVTSYSDAVKLKIKESLRNKYGLVSA